MHRAQGTGHRAQGRASQLVLKSLIGCAGLAAGCSDNGGERLAVLNAQAVITEADAARLPFYCDGPVERAPQLILANIEDVAIPYHCNSASGASFTKLVDDRGDLVEFDQLRMRDALAFRDLHNRMAPELEVKAIEASGKLKVGVWFAVPEDVSRSASEIVLLSEAERSNERAVVEKRIGALAAELASKLDAAVPGISVASYSPGLKGQAPYLAVEASPDELRAIGLLGGIVELTLNIPPEDEKAESEVWYDLDRIQDLIDNGEYVGAGVTIVDILGENGVWDSYDLGLKPGNCQPAVGGPFYTCYCPPAAPNSPGSQSHLQDVLGIIKNDHPGGLRGGAATGATTIVGNVSTAYCATASIADAVDWAIINQGASVVNRSASMGTQSSRYLDWASSTNPWPTVVTAAGNTAGTVTNSTLNAIVVGAANDQGQTNPGLCTLATFTSWQNPSGGASGYEVPHVVAPGVNVSTVPQLPGQADRLVSGTSFAAPQVSAIVADLQQKHANLKFWPSASLALLMVSAEQSIDGAGWLSLSDGQDDKDGAGLVNARGARRACDKVDGGATAQQSAFDYGTFFSSSLSAGATYSEVWNAQVPAFYPLRVALKVTAMNSCTLGNEATCSAQRFPRITLTVRKAGVAVGVSANINSTYQFVEVGNGNAASTYTIEARLDDWDTLTLSDFGVAWSSERFN